jgi:hypothetical protein
MDELWGGSGPPGPPPYLRHCGLVYLGSPHRRELALRIRDGKFTAESG